MQWPDLTKLRICEDAAPGSNEMEVGYFDDSLGQFLMMFGLLGQFFLKEKPQKKLILVFKKQNY